MKHILLLYLMCLMAVSSVRAGDSEMFLALSKVQHATLLSSEELSGVEGSTVFYGTTRVPVPSDSISTFMTEVLFTFLHVDGRTPLVTYTTTLPVVTPLPNGGVSVGVESHTVILVKTLVCTVCTKF